MSFLSLFVPAPLGFTPHQLPPLTREGRVGPTWSDDRDPVATFAVPLKGLGMSVGTATNPALWGCARMQRTLVGRSIPAIPALATAMGHAGCSYRKQAPVAPVSPAEMRPGAVPAAARPAAMAVEAHLVRKSEPDAGAPEPVMDHRLMSVPSIAILHPQLCL